MNKRVLSDDIGNLIQTAKSCLDINYEDLKNFYCNIFLKSEKFHHIVFIVRRSFVLAEMFYNILLKEYENDQEKLDILNEVQSKFCTDSRFISLSKNVVEELCSGYMSKFLIVDEIVIIGNSLNNLIDSFNDSVINELNKKNINLSEKKVKDIIIGSIEINVFTRNDAILDLKYEYKKKFYETKKMKPLNWHYFSNCNALLVNKINLSNLSFIAPVFLKSKEIEWPQILDFEKFKIVTPELTETIYIHKNSFGKVIATVRIIRYDNTGEYEFLPFVFIPNIKNDVLNSLKDEIKTALNNKSILESFSDKTEYELCLLYLNKLLLDLFFKNFNQEYELDQNSSSIDYLKLKANYGFSDNDIENLICNVDFNLKPFESCIHEILSQIDTNYFQPNELKPCSTEFKESSFSHAIENELYLTKLNEVESDLPLFVNLSNLNNFFNLNELYDIVKQNNPTEFVSWMLQYMDNGVVALKVEQRDGLCSQYFKTGESSLALYPKRYFEYIPSLISIRLNIDKRYVSLENEIIRFVDILKDNGVTGLRETLAKELFAFVVFLDKSNQNLESWNFNLKYRYDVFENRSKYSKLYLGI